MTYGELAARLKKFKADLVEHRSLYAQSLNSTMRTFPVRNGEKLQTQEEVLTGQLYLLEPYLNRFANQRIRTHPATRTSWDIFKTAVGNDAAIIKGSSLNDAILELAGVIAIVESKPAGQEVPAAEAAKNTRPQTSTLSGDINISGGNVTIGGGTINVNNINLADFIRQSLGVIDEKVPSPEQASKLKGMLSRVLDSPLGKLLSQVAVGEVLKHF
jgi:hypothetical protein